MVKIAHIGIYMTDDADGTSLYISAGSPARAIYIVISRAEVQKGAGSR